MDIYNFSQIKKLDKEIDEVDGRIDAIITTLSVSAEEIIDARDGKNSLGKNIRDLKAEVGEFADDYENHVDDFYELQTEVEQVKTDYLAHTKNIMPHEFQDLKNDKTYKYGFQISEEGNPQLIFKEVENV